MPTDSAPLLSRPMQDACNIGGGLPLSEEEESEWEQQEQEFEERLTGPAAPSPAPSAT